MPLAEHAVVVSCTVRPGERAAWAGRIAREAGLALPAGLETAIAEAAPDLLAVSQEVDKLAALADAKGRVPGEAAGALRGAQVRGSLDRWVEAALASDMGAARAEAAALETAGIGASAALWALAERALSSLEPGALGGPRRTSAGALPPATARRVLDAVYRVDRAIKRGQLRDEDWTDAIVPALSGAAGET